MKTKLEIVTQTGTILYLEETDYKVEQEIIGNGQSGLRATGNLVVSYTLHGVRCCKVYAKGFWLSWEKTIQE